MKRARITEAQITGILREREGGAKTGDLARNHGVSEATIRNWKANLANTLSRFLLLCGMAQT